MALFQHDLRRRISEGTSHGSQHLVLGVEHLSDTEIGQHEGRVGFACEVKKVLGLEICANVSAKSRMGRTKSVPL